MKNKKRLLLLITAIALLTPLYSSAQNSRVPSDKKKPLHQETLDDPYLPNAWNNKKTSPAYKYRNNGALKITTGSIIFTNQVNVDASGQNILGDAANEPNITVNPLNPNEIAIGWRQFDNVSSNFRQAGWSYSTDAGQTWTFPGVIEPGIFRSDPVLDYDSSGNFYYNSLTNSPTYLCKVFESTNGGATWNNGTDAAGGDKQWMAIDRTAGVGSGNIYSVWTSVYSSCPPGFFTRSTNGGSSYENCTEVDSFPWWGTMAVGNAGELYIGSGSSLMDSLLVVKSLNAQITGSLISWNPVLVYLDGYLNGWVPVNPVGLLGQVNIDVDRSSGAGQGNVYVCASVSRLSNFDPGDVMLIRSTDGGQTWSAPIQINDDPSQNNTQWFGTMSVAPNGRIDAIWLDTRDNPGSDESALYYSYSTDQGNTWSVNEKLSASFDPHVGYPNQDKMGDYFDMISDNSGAHLAWANTLNGEEDVYYSYIIPSINTGVNEISGNGTFSVFPNPTNGIFVITGILNQSLPVGVGIEICTVLGEKIYEATIHSVRSPSDKTKTEIDISAQPAGIYFLKIINRDGSTVVKKIMRE
ncbi:MAG TPA: T9SS type A sorting domain-containing protein [Bacteroidia bacterium]|nr:T9SS type A sorting domain-containing protein [Bacteroidia bacterium]